MLEANMNKRAYTENPEMHLHSTEPKWFAIYTKYKREKIVHRHLESKGIESYLPLQTITRQYGRHRKTVQLPLISCYLFVKIVKSEYVPVLETDDVVKFINFSRNLISIREEEIQLLQQIVGEGIPITAEAINFQKGDPVEIIRGNLSGLKGILIGQTGKKEMIVDLSSMNYSLRLQLDPKLLRKI